MSGKVRGILNYERPEGALSRLQEVLAPGHKVKGVIICVVTEDDDHIQTVDSRTFGNINPFTYAYLGAALAHHAVKGTQE